MQARFRYPPLMLLALIGASALSAQQGSTNAEYTGYWTGSLKLGVELRLQFHVEADPAGKFRTTMVSLDQTPTPIPVDSTIIANGEFRLVLTALRAGFVGKFDEQHRLAGSFSQAGMAYPLVLTHSDSPATRPARPQTPVAPFPYRSDNVTFPNARAGIILAGTLTQPTTPGLHPVVVLISGSGAQDRDETLLGHKPFLVLADYLTRRGIAVLRVDDRGVGGSSGSQATATSDDFTGDALAAVDFLKTRPGINPARIGLIGHSEGGMIAPLAATRSKDVAFIVMLAGPGVRGDTLLTLQVRAIVEISGASPQTVAYVGALRGRVNAIFASSADEATIRRETEIALREELARAGITDSATVKQEQANMATLITASTQPWMRYFLRYDPRPALLKLTVPVLALNGAKDRQVTPTENLAGISSALTAGGNKDFITMLLPNLNHLFQTAQTGAPTEYSTIEETFSPTALQVIGDWIVAHTKN